MRRIYISILALFFLAAPASFAFATTGTIVSPNQYAWNDNGGYVNWLANGGNVTVTDTVLTGDVWSAGFGWINLSPTNGGVTNSAGTLSGSAWGANTGWINFSGVTIDSNGVFHGHTVAQATFGTMTFDCDHCDVVTSWRAPVSSSGGSGGGGSVSGGATAPPVGLRPPSVAAAAAHSHPDRRGPSSARVHTARGGRYWTRKGVAFGRDLTIRLKEMRGDEAQEASEQKVLAIEYLFIEQLQELQSVLLAETNFYKIGKNTYEEAHARLAYLKDVVENKGGHKFFYDDKGTPIEREKDLHVLYRLVWFGTPSDAGAEANDGRGPVDFKISRGRDKTLVEMKLAKNTKLAQNLANQTQIYQAASDAKRGIKAIIYFTASELARVKDILKRLDLLNDKDVVLIDARRDNKPSASKAA